MKLQIINRLNKKDKIHSNNIKQILQSNLYLYDPPLSRENCLTEPIQFVSNNTVNEQDSQSNQRQCLKDFFDKFYTVCMITYDSKEYKAKKLNRQLYPFLQLANSPNQNKRSKISQSNKGVKVSLTKHSQISLKSVNPKIRKINSEIALKQISQFTDNNNVNKQKHSKKSLNKRRQKESLRSSKRSDFDKENIDNNLNVELRKKYQSKFVCQIRQEMSQLKKMSKLKNK